MKILTTIALIFTIFLSTLNATTFTLDGCVIVKRYNDVWKQLYDAQVQVYVDDDGAAYVSLQRARGYISPKDIPKLNALLQKAQEWAEKAKNDKIEVTKELGLVSHEMGRNHMSGVSLRFISEKEAQEIYLVMKVADFDNQFTNETCIIGSDQFPQFIELLKSIPEGVKKLKENAKKSEMFK